MASVSYTTVQAVVTKTQRATVYRDKLPSFLIHLDALDINLLGLVLNADHTITITLDAALTPEQTAHLGFQ